MIKINYLPSEPVSYDNISINNDTITNLCSIASKKLNLIDLVRELENEPDDIISKLEVPDIEQVIESKNPHGFRFFYRNYIEEVPAKGKGTQKSKVYALYTEYCNDNNIKELPPRQFHNKMNEKGYISYKISIMYYRLKCNYVPKKECT
tara:strand:- start:77 stop:523 length:447 start_codon:yes stop_codon:yes gene_type:complete